MMADVRHDYIRSRLTPIGALTVADIDAMFAPLAHHARAEYNVRWVCPDAHPPGARARPALCGPGLRNRGAVRRQRFASDGKAGLRQGFDTTHRKCSAMQHPNSRSRWYPIGWPGSAWCRLRRCGRSSRAATRWRMRYANIAKSASTAKPSRVRSISANGSMSAWCCAAPPCSTGSIARRWCAVARPHGGCWKNLIITEGAP